MSSAGTSSSASATSSSNCAWGSAFTGSPRPGSPRRGQRPALPVAGRAMHAEHRALVQLLDRAGAGVGAGRADAGDDPVDQVLDAGALGVQVHPRRAEPLLAEARPRALEPRLARRPRLDRPRGGHAERLLVEPAAAVVVDVARALV